MVCWAYSPICMCTQEALKLLKTVHLCCLFDIAVNTTALSHLGKQVIAISIIYTGIQQSRPQTILTNRLTEINAAAHKQTYSPPLLPIPFTRHHLFSSLSYLFSPVLFKSSIFYCVICHSPLSVLLFCYLFALLFFPPARIRTNPSLLAVT